MGATPAHQTFLIKNFLPSFISLPLLQAAGGVADTSGGLRIFTAVRGVFVIFLAEHTVFHDIFGGFVSAKSCFFLSALCYLTGGD